MSILRRLDRNGEGEYRLAGARCRLIDVIELLSDTGMGKEMHSVISQGRVEAIVTSKPRDRRLLIEEAAGLGKHRKRRRRAQLKLAHTQENLDRALDVEREARSRRRPHQRHAEAAELHARLHRQMLEIRWELAREELRARLAEVTVTREQAGQARAAREELEAELEQVALPAGPPREALAERSSQREQLSRRSFAAQSASDRVGYRIDSIRSQPGTVGARAGPRALTALETLRSEVAAADQPDDAAWNRSLPWSDELEALERDRETELTRQLTELEPGREAAEQAEAGCAVGGGAGRDRAGAGGGRSRAGSSRRCAKPSTRWRRRGARALGWAASWPPSTSSCAATRVPRVAARRWRTPCPWPPATSWPCPRPWMGVWARLWLTTARPPARCWSAQAGTAAGCFWRACPGPRSDPPALRRCPAPSAWLIGWPAMSDARRAAGSTAPARCRGWWRIFEALPDEFDGIATTRQGRVFSPALRELRQAASVGDERILAERNRRDELVAASENAVQTEYASAGRPRSGMAWCESAARDADREAAIAAHRAAVRRP